MSERTHLLTTLDRLRAELARISEENHALRDALDELLPACSNALDTIEAFRPFVEVKSRADLNYHALKAAVVAARRALSEQPTPKEQPYGE